MSAPPDRHRHLLGVSWPPTTVGCPLLPAPGTWGWLGPVTEGGPLKLGGPAGLPRGVVYRNLHWYATDAEGESVAEGHGRSLAEACAKVESAAGAPKDVARFPGWRLAGPDDPPPTPPEPAPRPPDVDRARSVAEGLTRYLGWWRTEEGGIQWVDHGPSSWLRQHEEEAPYWRAREGEWGYQSRVFPVEDLAPSPPDDILVLLSEEYDEQFWIWRTGLSADGLRQWWEAQETTVIEIRTLPGTAERVTAILFAGDGTHEIWSRHADANAPDSPEYTIRRAPPNSWTGRLWRDQNSALWPPTGETILHAGFQPEPGESPEDLTSAQGSEYRS